MNYKFIKIYQDKNLSANEILMLGLIQNLCLIGGADKCVISHSKIFELFPCQISERTVRNTLDSLKNKNYIEIRQNTKKTAKNEYVLINHGKNYHSAMVNSTTHYGKNCHSTMAEITEDTDKNYGKNYQHYKNINIKENIYKNINKENNTKNNIPFKFFFDTKISKPDIETIIYSIKQIKPELTTESNEIANSFYYYYEEIDWMTKNNQPIKDWFNSLSKWISNYIIFTKKPSYKKYQTLEETHEQAMAYAEKYKDLFGLSTQQINDLKGNETSEAIIDVTPTNNQLLNLFNDLNNTNTNTSNRNKK